MHHRMVRALIVLFVAVLCLVALSSALVSQSQPSYGSDPEIEKRIDDIMARMSLQEKIQFLRGDGDMASLGNTRLGIPGIQMADSPQGVRADKPATVFPAPVLMGATWDPELVRRVGVALGEELRAEGRDMLLGPCVNIHRSPLGGRDTESFSEDPFLMSRMAVAYVQGVQSRGAVACVKHFAANNQETRRLSVNAEADQRFLNEIEFPAFRAAVEEGGALAVMAAYNSVNGHFSWANSELLSGVLRNQWKFRGVIVTDWGAEWSLPAPQRTIDAMNAGLDIVMPAGYGYGDPLLQAVQDGQVNVKLVDDKLRLVLRLILSLGLDNPDRKSKIASVVSTAEHQQLSRDVAAAGMVLLKNDRNILPLDRHQLHSIAVIGPNADVARLGDRASAYVPGPFSVSPLEALRKKLGESVTIHFSKGFEISGFQAVAPMAMKPPKGFSGERGLRVEYFAKKDPDGSPLVARMEPQVHFDPADPSLADIVREKEYSVRWSGTLTAPQSAAWFLGLKSDARCDLFLDGRLFLTSETHDASQVKSLGVNLQAGQPREFAIELHVKKGTETGHLEFVWAAPPPDVFSDAVEAARSSDVAVVFAGLNTDYEGEGLDRFNMNLPALQDELIQAVHSANPRTIVVINSGSPNDMRNWVKSVPAILQAWYPGMEGGSAVADVLFGDVNPSGKLPDTFGMRREDYADWPNFPGTGDSVKYSEGIFVGYRHFDAHNIEPLFPFGYGLSYTNFSYSNLNVAAGPGAAVEVGFDVRNTGGCDGKEVAQLYVANPDRTLPHPPKELRAFQKLSLAAGETQHVRLHVDRQSLSYYDPGHSDWVFAPGSYEIMVGSSSRDIRLRGTAKVN